MRILELYQDYHIQYVTEGSKHCREGWVNIECPFCTGNPGYHLGFNLDGNYFHCWRCGGKWINQVISKILHISITKADEIIEQYGGVSAKLKKKPKVKLNTKSLKFPFGNGTLQNAHKHYLASRGFDPEKIEAEWNLLGTGPWAFLDGINYSRRILAPIHWDGKMVSFQTRDITNRHPVKYLACPQNRELIQHQQILYGKQKAWKHRKGICVEGITDVWRFGELSFATFGIDFTHYQVREMIKHFDEIVVLFDPDPQAIRQAKKLVGELKFRGIIARYEILNTDPGDMTQVEANHLLKHLKL